MAAFNLGVDTGLWKLMAKNGSQPQKVDDLARELKIDPVLLGAYVLSTLEHDVALLCKEKKERIETDQ